MAVLKKNLVVDSPYSICCYFKLGRAFAGANAAEAQHRQVVKRSACAVKKGALGMVAQSIVGAHKKRATFL